MTKRQVLSSNFKGPFSPCLQQEMEIRPVDPIGNPLETIAAPNLKICSIRIWGSPKKEAPMKLTMEPTVAGTESTRAAALRAPYRNLCLISLE